MAAFDRFIEDFSSKKVLIFGLGLLGRGVGDAALFAQIGSQVRVTDLKSEEELKPSLEKLKDYDIDYTLGEHKREDVDWADVIIRNASVPWDHEMLQYAREENIPVYMDTQLFVSYSNCLTIGITGTRGKTTTTHLIHHIASENLAEKTVLLGGNVSGVATLSLLPEVMEEGKTLAVLELSSWQLQAFRAHKISPNIAVITNIYPDHLNSYPSMEEYQEDKKAIFLNQGKEDRLYLNQALPLFKQWAKEALSQTHFFSPAKLPQGVRLSIPGKHNRENAAAAYEVSRLLHINEESIIKSLNSFPGVPHRLQTVAVVNGITYINDTTSTTPVATIKALESFTQPVHLILGGSDKRLPTDELIDAVSRFPASVALLKGSGTDKIKDQLNQELIVGEYASLSEAFEAATKRAKNGEVVLLSPGFASFGMFVNEFDRGEQFIKLVESVNP